MAECCLNRIDKVMVFNPLGDSELHQILDLELNQLQQRIISSAHTAPFVFSLTDYAKDFLIREGTDAKYGARHLKRAIDRVLVQPLSNLISTGQIPGGDSIRVDFDPALGRLAFYKDAEEYLYPSWRAFGGRYARRRRSDLPALAYEFWHARGCPVGSPEEDWFRAEGELQSRREKRLRAA